jgi:hypothetical protein
MLYIYVASETDLKVGTTMQVVEVGEKEVRDRTVVRRVALAAQQQGGQGAVCAHTITKRSAIGIITCVDCGEPL